MLCNYTRRAVFFVECGAHDGEFLSNTLYMERYLNWSGILIEPMKNRYTKLVSRNRKSHTVPVCLSLEQTQWG